MLLVLVLLPIAPDTFVFANKEKPRPSFTKEGAREFVMDYANQSELSPQMAERMWATIRCENPELEPTLQSRHINKKGEREKSYGLAQIHLPSWPNISYRQATNPSFAAKFMATKFKEGQQQKWSCYRMLFNSPEGDSTSA